MSRIKVRYHANEYEAPSYGWFESDSAEAFQEDTYWDGNNHRGKCSQLQIGREILYRTKGGRWVLYHDGSSEHNGPEYHQFIDDERAKTWLLTTDLDDVVEKYFGEMAEEIGPGRPEIGNDVKIRLGDLLPRVDTWAAERDLSRAEALRRLVAAGLTASGSQDS
jgi:hypothetical protein